VNVGVKIVLFLSESVMTGPFAWICWKLLAVTSVRVESNIFKKTPYFPALLQFSELLAEDFGFNAD
jgi:hypothetical protein